MRLRWGWMIPTRRQPKTAAATCVSWRLHGASVSASVASVASAALLFSPAYLSSSSIPFLTMPARILGQQPALRCQLPHHSVFGVPTLSNTRSVDRQLARCMALA
jgi:hypothetical protein